MISKINPANSETLSLSASQFRRRKQKTIEAVKAIHCDSHVYTSEKEQTKSVKDGLWTTLITWRDERLYIQFQEMHGVNCSKHCEQQGQRI